MNSDGYIYFLNALSRLYSKTGAHNLSKYDQNGWGNSLGVNLASTQNQQFHQLLLFTRDSAFCLVHVHVYDTRC